MLIVSVYTRMKGEATIKASRKSVIRNTNVAIKAKVENTNITMSKIPTNMLINQLF